MEFLGSPAHPFLNCMSSPFSLESKGYVSLLLQNLQCQHQLLESYSFRVVVYESCLYRLEVCLTHLASFYKHLIFGNSKTGYFSAYLVFYSRSSHNHCFFQSLLAGHSSFLGNFFKSCPKSCIFSQNDLLESISSGLHNRNSTQPHYLGARFISCILYFP